MLKKFWNGKIAGLPHAIVMIANEIKLLIPIVLLSVI
jgi:hypothetical protein